MRSDESFTSLEAISENIYVGDDQSIVMSWQVEKPQEICGSEIDAIIAEIKEKLDTISGILNSSAESPELAFTTSLVVSQLMNTAQALDETQMILQNAGTHISNTIISIPLG